MNIKNPPGTVINYSPSNSGLYIGSPSICKLKNGNLIATHDFFGPNSNEFTTPTVLVFKSKDDGKTWKKISEIKRAFWSGLFTFKDDIYLMGTLSHHGDIYIRKSEDGGYTWTYPTDNKNGLLTNGGKYHTSTMPIIEHEGKLWRTFEDATGGSEWGLRYKAGLLSIDMDLNLLEAKNWEISNFLLGDKSYNNNSFNGWLEGNIVITPTGEIKNIIRIDSEKTPEKAAVLNIENKEINFKNKQIIDFPGGSKKFTIRLDKKTKTYYSISSIILKEYENLAHPMRIRNTLALITSKDLITWKVKKILLKNEDYKKVGFQYVDWIFDNNDIIAVCRTAFSDKFGGANNCHDANFITYHKWENFRNN